MSSTTLELYNALIDAGIEKTKAQKVAETVVSREEAKEFATKADLVDLKKELQLMESRITVKIYAVGATATGIIIAAVALL